jgi:hypothetical protein
VAQSTKHNKRLRGCVHFLAIISLVVIIVTLRACFLRPMTNYPGSHFNRHRNATWLGVEWSMESHSAEAIAALADDHWLLQLPATLDAEVKNKKLSRPITDQKSETRPARIRPNLPRDAGEYQTDRVLA